MEKKEIWKDIPGTKGYYQASTLGNIRSVERKLLSGKKCSSKLIKPILSNKYYSVSICTTNKKNIRVHKLVAMAFLECPKADNLQINHINKLYSIFKHWMVVIVGKKILYTM